MCALLFFCGLREVGVGQPAPTRDYAKGAKHMSTTKMDDLGRILLPREVREALEWDEGTQLEIGWPDPVAKSVVIRQARPRCSLCRKNSEGLTSVDGGWVCPDCRAALTGP